MQRELLFVLFYALVLEILWLATDMGYVHLWHTPASVTADVQPMGTVVIKKNKVQRKAKDGLLWEVVSQTGPVYPNDLILTFDESAADIQLEAGANIDLIENTLIKIDPPLAQQNPTTLGLRHGSAKIKVSERQPKFQLGDYIVENGKGKGAEIVVTSDDQEKVSLTLISGKADLTAAITTPGTKPEPPIHLKINQTTEVPKNSVPGRTAADAMAMVRESSVQDPKVAELISQLSALHNSAVVKTSSTPPTTLETQSAKRVPGQSEETPQEKDFRKIWHRKQ